MGLIDRLRDLTKPYDDNDDDIEDAAPAPKRSPDLAEASRYSSPPRGSGYSGFSSDYGELSASAPAPRDNKVVNIHATTQLQVVLVKPDRFENAAEIADHLCEKRTVVMNLEQTNKDTSRRLIDFLSGVAYAQDGKIKKVAVSTYIITPYNVDIMGDLMDELESNGLYI